MGFFDSKAANDTAERRSRLAMLCETVTAGLRDFVRVGDSLAEIRDQELYKLEAGTFEAFCRDRWDMTARYAGDLMTAANLCRQLSVTGSAPSSVRQAVALASLPEAVRVEAWTEAQASTDASGKVPAKAVHAAVKKRSGSALRKSGARLKKRSIRAQGGRVLVEPNSKGLDYLTILRSAVAILEQEAGQVSRAA
jgi:hypothetical protein